MDDDVFLLKYVFIRCDTVSENNYGSWKDGQKFFRLNHQKLRLSFFLSTFWLINAGVDMVSFGVNNRAYGNGTYCIIFGYNVEYAQVTPTRSPVYEPGPTSTAIRSMSPGFQPISFSVVLMAGINSFPCCMPAPKSFAMIICLFSQTAMPPISPDVSIPSTFIDLCLRNSLLCKVRDNSCWRSWH